MPVALALGLLVAGCFGSGDFLGGRAAREASTLAVLLVAQVTAVGGAMIVAAAVAGDPTGRDLAFGAAAGVVLAAGLGFLYHGLGTGRVGVVAPVTAVVGALVPVTWGLVAGERLGPLALAGVALAVAAGGLIAREPDVERAGSTRRSLVLAVVAGALLGSSLVLFSETSETSGLWPVLAARVAATVAVAAAVGASLARGATVRFPRRGSRVASSGAGALDVAGTSLLLVAVRHGLVAEVAPVVALAPAFTVVLAWGVLHEPVTRHQVAGLVLALAGLALIGAG